MKTLLIVSSYHHRNTLKVAEVIAELLQANIVPPGEVRPDTLSQYDLIGFGSGIYSAKHHPALLRLAEELPITEDGNAFLFSTDGMPRFAVGDEAYLHRKLIADHAALRKKLIAKGYTILGDFGCAGYNTNSFLKLFGGINRGRPNARDLHNAAVFTSDLSSRSDLRGN